jgi:hypothetical protein
MGCTGIAKTKGAVSMAAILVSHCGGVAMAVLSLCALQKEASAFELTARPPRSVVMAAGGPNSDPQLGQAGALLLHRDGQGRAHASFDGRDRNGIVERALRVRSGMTA